jgi:hypothetical protein
LWEPNFREETNTLAYFDDDLWLSLKCLTLTPDVSVIKLFSLSVKLSHNKLDCLSRIFAIRVQYLLFMQETTSSGRLILGQVQTL